MVRWALVVVALALGGCLAQWQENVDQAEELFSPTGHALVGKTCADAHNDFVVAGFDNAIACSAADVAAAGCPVACWEFGSERECCDP